MNATQKEAVSCFRRYRRALRSDPFIFWDAPTQEQWVADRMFFENAYASKRDTTFEGAMEYAQEQLFLRCFFGEEDK